VSSPENGASPSHPPAVRAAAIGGAAFAAWALAALVVGAAGGPEGAAGGDVIGVLLAFGWLVVAPAALALLPAAVRPTPPRRRLLLATAAVAVLPGLPDAVAAWAIGPWLVVTVAVSASAVASGRRPGRPAGAAPALLGRRRPAVRARNPERRGVHPRRDHRLGARRTSAQPTEAAGSAGHPRVRRPRPHRSPTMTVHFTAHMILPLPIEEAFALTLDIDAHLASMARSGERAVAGTTSGIMGPGESVTWKARHLGLPWTMTSTITEWERPTRFVDEQTRGPFAWFRHEHRFTPVEDGTAVVDDVTFAAPCGPLGRLAEAVILGRHLERLIAERNAYLVAEAGRRRS
jgi:ligand-binding SRPBCC domain-containing protein